MKILSLGLTKISCEKFKPIKNPFINNHIQFTEVEKENLDFVTNGQVLKISFKHVITYSSEQDPSKIKEENKQGELIFQGFLLLTVTKEEQKEFEKSWKKKQIPESQIVPIYNYILRKCSIKALPLQDEIGLPSPFFNFPRIQKAEQDSTKK